MGEIDGFRSVGFFTVDVVSVVEVVTAVVLLSFTGFTTVVGVFFVELSFVAAGVAVAGIFDSDLTPIAADDSTLCTARKPQTKQKIQSLGA